jgi:hypothetical protein
MFVLVMMVKAEEVVNHLDVVLLNRGRSSKLSRMNNLSRARELGEYAKQSGSRSRRTDQNGVRVLAAASFRGSARTILVVRVEALVLCLDLICLLLVVKANLGSLRVPASAKNLSCTRVSNRPEGWQMLLTNLIVGDVRTLVLDDLVTLLAVKDVGVGRSWNMDTVGRELRTLDENGLGSALNIQEHSTITKKITRNSKMEATLLAVTSVDNRLSELNPGEEHE